MGVALSAAFPLGGKSFAISQDNSIPRTEGSLCV